jgi:hypothetical protein
VFIGLRLCAFINTAVMRKKHVFTGFLLVILFVVGSITGANAQCSANAGVDTSICKGLRFTRTALFTPVAASVKWYLVGDAVAVSNSPTIDMPMNTAGTFRYAVEVSSALCAAPKYDTVVVVVNMIPDASLSDFLNPVTPFSVCGTSGGNQLEITNTSSTGPSNASYEISWGDATPNFSSIAASFPVNTGTATHNYTSSGYYTLTNTVTGTNGCKGVKSYAVYRGSNPQVPFQNPGSTVGLCAPYTYSIPSQPTNNSIGTVYIVTINDGSPVETFTSLPAVYSHVFTTTSCGATGGISPNTFRVEIRAQNPCGYSFLTIEPIAINDKPRSNFTISSDTNICINSTVSLTNTSTNGVTVSNSGVCTYTSPNNWIITPTTGWTLSAGSTLGNAIPNSNPATWGSANLGVTFSASGVYTIRNIVQNSCGRDTMIKTISVTGPTPPQVVSPVNYNQGAMAVPLTATGTGLRWYTAAVGGVGSTIAPTPSTANVGSVTYYVSQGAPNCEGSRSSIVVNVISATANRPTANFSFSNPCGRAVQFTNQSSTPTGTITQYQWTFNQGTTLLGTSSQPNPTFTFPAAGVTYNAQLVVTNSVGLKDSTRQNIITHNGPKALLASEQSTTTINGEEYIYACTFGDSLFTFYNISLNSNSTTTYLIRWGDGTSNTYNQSTFTPPASSGSFVTHKYNTGFYTLTFVMTNNGSCVDSFKYKIFFGTIPVGGLGANLSSTICTGSTESVVISNINSNTAGTVYDLVFNDGTDSLRYIHPIPNPLVINHTFDSTSCGTNSSNGSSIVQNSFGAYLTIRNPCGTRVLSVVPIYVTSKPKSDFKITSYDTVCIGQSVTLTNTGNPGNDIDPVDGRCIPGKSIWQITPNTPASRFTVTSGILGTIATSNPLYWTSGTNSVNVRFDSAGIYTVRIISANNLLCGRDTMTKTVVVNGPTPPQVVSPVNYNQGAMAVPLTATGTGLRWYTAAVGGVGSTIAPTPSTANVGSVTYYVSQGAPNCEGARSSIVVNVSNGTRQQVGINVIQPQRSLHVNDMMRLEPRSAPPTNPAEGDIYYDGVLKKLRYYNGTTWKDL